MQANQIETAEEAPINSGKGKYGLLGLNGSTWAIIALVLTAAILRVIGLPSREVHPDEWYHVLAGTSWANGDGLTFIRGIYDRAWPFTVSAGLVQNWLGLEGFVASRLPAMISGVLCVWLLFVLGKRSVSSTVGLLAAALLAFDAMSIEWSQIGRFYTLQTALILTIACIFSGPVFPSQGASLQRMIVSLTAAGAIAILALVVQIISIVAIAGLAAFLFTQTRYFSLDFASTPSRERVFVGVALAIGAVLGVMAAIYMWPELRVTQAWTAQDKDNFLYYDDYLRAMYGVLWPLTPLAVLIGLSHSRRGVFIALSVVVPVVLVQSVGGMKAPRYIMQAMPFLFLLWAIGLRSGFLWLAGMIRDRVPFGDFGPGKTTSYLAALAVLAFALAGNLSFRNTIKWTLNDGRAVLAGQSVLSGNPINPELDRSVRDTAPLLREDAMLISTDPQVLAHYGMISDFDMSNPLDDDDIVFTFSDKSGLVELDRPSELAGALSCLEKADIVVREASVGTFLIPQPMQDVLDGWTTRVESGGPAVRLYQWTNPNVTQNDTCGLLTEAMANLD